MVGVAAPFSRVRSDSSRMVHRRSLSIVQTRRATILVVDDDEDTRQNLSDILEDLDYDVDIAESGEAALERVRSKPYDLALLDLKMPGMSGIALYHEIRRERPGTVAMIVTAFATEEAVEEAYQSGVWHVLSKPVDFSRLLPLVQTAVNQPLLMIVDDDRELCDSLWDIFRQHDLRVCLAHDTKEAESRLKESSYQVVLVDLKLPDGDGMQVLSRVEETNPEARAILITGHRHELEHDGQQNLPAQADAVCFKPFDVVGLLDTISRLIGRSV